MSCFARQACKLPAWVAVLALGGCVFFAQPGKLEGKSRDCAPDQINLRLSLDKKVYRPGEAMVMEVALTNTTGKEQPLPRLDVRSLSFWFGQVGEERRLQRTPVVSKKEEKDLKEKGGEEASLKPGQSWTRSFVHTGLTPETGQYVAQVHLESVLAGTSADNKLYSNAPSYQVQGERLFKRDSQGLLELGEAFDLAAKQLTASVVSKDGILIEDEMGFYKWWINLDTLTPDGRPVKTGFLIDPYLGRVWSKAQPFDESLKRTQSSEKPAGIHLQH
jgi:hypothetical protein